MSLACGRNQECLENPRSQGEHASSGSQDPLRGGSAPLCTTVPSHQMHNGSIYYMQALVNALGCGSKMPPVKHSARELSRSFNTILFVIATSGEKKTLFPLKSNYCD